MTTLLATLRERGCLQDVSHPEELEPLLERDHVVFYCGFDPTASSLHVGSMLPLIMMRRFQRRGHRPIVLLGSGTGMIGDPSGKSEERKLLDDATLRENVHGIEKQISLFLDASGSAGFTIVKNHEWLASINILDFLRDVGKHFSVNAMLLKDSVRARIEGREQGISFTEFSYMLLQAYDFYWLNKEHGCRMQIGGSDQWGNITAGLDLVRRKRGEGHPQVFGMTFPLLTTTSGRKFGKTEEGAVWLDPSRTSPYQFYQYWISTHDADVIRYLNLFTDVRADELAELDEKLRTAPEVRAPQLRLARELTELVHGATETARAIQASKVLFGESLDQVSAGTLLEVFSDVPSTDLPADRFAAGLPLVELLVECGLASSKGAARRSIEGGGIYVNNERAVDPQTVIGSDRLVDGHVLVLRSGRKTYHLVRRAS